MDCQEKMDTQVSPAPKENQQKKASRVNVDQGGTLVLLDLKERGVHLVCQASVEQEILERRAVKGDRVSLDLLDHLVQKVSQVKA